MPNLDGDFYDMVEWLVVFLLGILEFRRGWIILVRKEIAFITGIPILFRILEFFEFQNIIDKIKKNLTSEKNLKTSGWLGLILGSLIIVISIFSIRDFVGMRTNWEK